MPFNTFSFTTPPKKPHLPASSTPHPHPLHPHPSTYLSNPSSYNPWNPQTPSYHLYRSFKSFTSAENAARQQRGEQPFCTPAGRDQAFEKLVRLSRGEEPIAWRIEQGGWDGGFEAGCVEWGAQVEVQMEEERVGRWMGEGEEEEMRRAVEEGEREREKEKERKDSKEVCHAKEEGEWEDVGRMSIGDGDGDDVGRMSIGDGDGEDVGRMSIGDGDEGFADTDVDMRAEQREDVGDEEDEDGLEGMTIF